MMIWLGSIRDDDMARQYKRIYAQSNALIKKFYMCTEDVKCALFKSYCTSLYTCQLWYNYKSESIRKLCVGYNNVFRLLCNELKNCSASYMFVSRGLPTCKMFITKNVYSFMTCKSQSGNAILQSIMNSDALYTSPLVITGEICYIFIVFSRYSLVFIWM